MNIRKNDTVKIVGSAEECYYRDCTFKVFSDPYMLCGSEVVKLKCIETGKYLTGGYVTKFLRRVDVE